MPKADHGRWTLHAGNLPETVSDWKMLALLVDDKTIALRAYHIRCDIGPDGYVETMPIPLAGIFKAYKPLERKRRWQQKQNLLGFECGKWPPDGRSSAATRITRAPTPEKPPKGARQT
jgi:hypothetical protein